MKLDFDDEFFEQMQEGYKAETDPDEHNFRGMVELIPKIAHLQPPVICTPIRLDRFSPLYEDKEMFGLMNVRPYSSYYWIYPFDLESVANLAQFFEYDYAKNLDAETWARELHASVEIWKAGVGHVAFTSFERDGVLFLFDSRPCADASETRLNGIQRELIKACHSPISGIALSDVLGIALRDLQCVLDECIERNWVIRLGNHYLALPTPMNAYIPSGISDVVLKVVTQEIYCFFLKNTSESLRHSAEGA